MSGSTQSDSGATQRTRAASDQVLGLKEDMQKVVPRLKMIPVVAEKSVTLKIHGSGVCGKLPSTVLKLKVLNLSSILFTTPTISYEASPTKEVDNLHRPNNLVLLRQQSYASLKR